MANSNVYLKVKDHSVSGEDFELINNVELDLLETYPQPSAENLPYYYDSEDYISHTDSKRDWFEKGYHFIKQIALKRKLKLINQLASEERNLLDFGCGTGDFLKIAQDNGWNVYGVEPNLEARAIANVKTNVSVFDTNATSEFKKEQFNVITLWHVLEHLPKFEAHIEVLQSLLKPNGRLVIAVPNFNSYDAQYYKTNWAAFDVPRHLWHFSQKAISALAKNNNMMVEKTMPMVFDAYYVSLLSEKYKNGFMNPIKALWVGFLSNMKARRSSEYSSLIYIVKKLKN